MWLGDWLFGRPDERAYKIDVDDVRDIVAILEEEYPGIDVELWVASATHRRKVDPSELESLSKADLQRLSISAEVPGARDQGLIDRDWAISLRRRQTYFIVPQTVPLPDPSEPPVDPERVALRIREKISDASAPLLYRRQASAGTLALTVPLLLIIAVWIWVEIAVPLPVPIHVLGWTAIVAIAILSIPLHRAELMRYRPNRSDRNGHLVLEQTRETTKANRADSHRDLKVSVLSVLGAVTATLIVQAMLGLFG